MTIFDGKQPISAYLHEISAGRVPGKRTTGRFGANPTIDKNTTPQTIWGVGGIWIPADSAVVHDLVSSDANDAAAGTGATHVLVVGLDANFLQVTEIVAMNGTTSVQTLAQFIRITGFIAVVSGSARRNVGDITIRAQGASVDAAKMFAGKGSSRQAIYTCPANKKAYLYSYQASIIKASGASSVGAIFALELRQPGPTSPWTEAFSHGLAGSGTTTINVPLVPPVELAPQTDLSVICSEVTADGVSAAAGFSIVEEEV